MNLFKNISCIVIALLICVISYCQDGIQLNSDRATEGYSYFETLQESYLINNCGEIVNTWPTIRSTQLHSKLMDNGNPIYIKDNRIIVRDWDDNELSRTGYNATNVELVYEVIVMSNGHYLCLARENLTNAEFTAMGYEIDSGESPRRIDMVLEIDPDTETIVWQWNIKDHMIQQRNSSLENYGIIADNPRKMDMDAILNFDWRQGESFMINGFDYNEELDLIALSVRKLSEVIIIDHSTTTEEARGDSGGRHGHGGDALFRWGNPMNYGQGDMSDRELFFQHNPNWIEYGEHKGKLIMFNNGLSERTYSSVEIISPSVDEDGFFILPNNERYELTEEPISINALTFGPYFGSGYTSGAKVMPNGNIYVTVGQSERLFEMTIEGEIVWEYNIANAGYIYRSERYPKDFSGFDGRDLSVSGTVESPPSDYNCQLFTTSVVDINVSLLDVSVINKIDFISVTSDENKNFNYYLYNLNGQLINADQGDFNYEISTSDILTGMYYLRTERDGAGSTESIFIP